MMYRMATVMVYSNRLTRLDVEIVHFAEIPLWRASAGMYKLEAEEHEGSRRLKRPSR
jgi:hypothetical protein